MKNLLQIKTMKPTFDTLSILSVSFPEGKIQVDLSDGRSIAVPITWFSKLNSASKTEVNEFEISPGGYGIHWPKLDEDISIKAFI